MVYLTQYELYEYWLYHDTVYSCLLDYYPNGNITWYYGSGWEVEEDEQPTLISNLTEARAEALESMPKTVKFDAVVEVTGECGARDSTYVYYDGRKVFKRLQEMGIGFEDGRGKPCVLTLEFKEVQE